MKGLFEIASGSITGRNHWLIDQNNQDAYYSLSNELATIAVVCDGCGSGKHSEVGAKLGTRIIVETIATKLNQQNEPDFWEKIKQDWLFKLKDIAVSIAGGNPLSEIINDYFLFTVVGVLITASETIVFSIGDGVIAVNEKVTQIDSSPGNAPPYLGYSLCGYPEWSNLQIQDKLPTQEVKSIFLGTDGVSDLIKKEAHQLPGKKEKIGVISQFWQQDRYFKNPDMIRRRLSLINREISKADWRNQSLVKEVGLLPDDTTLIAIRKIF